LTQRGKETCRGASPNQGGGREGNSVHSRTRMTEKGNKTEKGCSPLRFREQVANLGGGSQTEKLDIFLSTQQIWKPLECFGERVEVQKNGEKRFQKTSTRGVGVKKNLQRFAEGDEKKNSHPICNRNTDRPGGAGKDRQTEVVFL